MSADIRTKADIVVGLAGKPVMDVLGRSPTLSLA